MSLTNKLKIVGWTTAFWLSEFETIFCDVDMAEFSSDAREAYRKSIVPQVEMNSSKITKRIGELYFLEGNTEKAEIYFEKSDFYRCLSEGKPVRNPKVAPIPYLVVDGNRFVGANGHRYAFGTGSVGPK